MNRALAAALAVCCSAAAWSAGAREEASLARSEYLADRGMIIPTHEVRIEDFIGGVDYGYPDPEGELGVFVYTGNRQVSVNGQKELLLVGVQGRRYGFEDLPPLNLVVVVDKSGSMREPDKLDWIRESLTVLLGTLRDRDYLSVVLFDTRVQVLLPSTRMGEPGLRRRLRRDVQGLVAGGSSDIAAGLEAGFREALVHFLPGSTNRVLLLTDGWGRAEGITKLVRTYRERGVEVSVIGYGENFDIHFAEAVAELGGGSSRFVSDRERLEEIFGSGLARTAVPLARNVRIEVTLDQGRPLGAWGLNPLHYHQWDQELKRAVHRMHFTVPVIHNGDHETAIAKLELPASSAPGRRQLARIRTRYTDLRGMEKELKPLELWIELVPADDPLTGFSDARVLKAGTMLEYAQALEQISSAYHQRRDIYQAFFRSFEMKKQLSNAATRLGDDGFADQIAVLESTMRITGREIGFKKGVVEQIIADNELEAPAPDRPLNEHLDYLFRELALQLEKSPPGNLAVSGFSVSGPGGSSLVRMLNEAGAVFLTSLGGSTHPVVERQRLAEVLREQELALSDLVEPHQAVTVGRILAADYLVTGTVIPMSESVVIFSRILNVETAVIESAAQVIVPRSAEVESLL